MRLFKKSFIYIIVISALSLGIAFAQQKGTSKTDLENRRAALMNEIAAAQRILQETKNEKSTSLAHLKALKAQMAARESLIHNLNQEVNNLDKSIVSTASEIEVLNKNIDVLKTNYARSVRYAYKHQNGQNMITFLLSAENFNDAMKRYQFMKRSRDFRLYQADKLKVNHERLAHNVSVLRQNKNKKTQHKSDQEIQKAKIAEESEETSLVVNELLSKEKDISADIAKKRADARQLDNTIKSIIKAEVELARKTAIEEARKKALLDQQKKAEELARKEAAEKAARATALAKQAAEENDRKAREAEIKRQQEIANNLKLEADRLKKAQEENERARKELARAAQDKQNKEREEALKKQDELAANLKKEEARLRKAQEENERAKRELANMNRSNMGNRSTTASSPSTSGTVVASKPVEPVKVTPPPAPVAERTETPNYKNSLTPEALTISNNFAANRGSLPWPVANGYVSTPFGNYTHPLEPKVTLQNLGIDITSSPGTAVRSVFAGTVSRVVKVAGTYTIVINHGEFFSVYSYLSTVSVRQGQAVGGKQNIGVVGPNDDGEHVVHFEICRVGANNNISNENPSAWIAR